MAYSNQFTAVTSATGAQLDSVLNQAGLIGTVPCVTSGTNALTMTPYTSGGVPNVGTPPFALQQQIRVSGLAANTNTGATTANVGGTGALNVYKDTPSGAVALTGSEIVIRTYFVLIYDGTLNAGAGGWHLQNQISAAAGTVTSVVGGSGLATTTITTTGTLAIANVANNTIFSNISGGSAVPIGNNLSPLLDALTASSVAGSLLVRASTWQANVETAWTPALAFGGSSTGITYGTQVGQYYSVANIIFAMFNIVLTSKGSSTGTATISLPVSSGGTNRIGGGLIFNYSNLTSVTTVPWATIAASASTATLVVAGSATTTNLADTNFANASTVQGIFFYLSA